MQKFSARNQQLHSVSPGLLIVVIFFAAGIWWAESFALPRIHVLLGALLLFCSLFIIHNFKIQCKPLVSRIILGFLFFHLGLLQRWQNCHY